jgi:tight adherence protein C
MEILGAGLFSLALFVAAYSMLAPRRNVTAERLSSIASDRTIGDAEEAPGLRERVVQPLLDGLARSLASLLPARLLRHFADQLAAAGHPVSPGTFFTMFLGVPAVLVTLVVLGALPRGLAPDLAALLALASGAFGVAGPLVWLRGRVTRRQARLSRELPDTLDLIVVSVEAGLGLEGAMARISERAPGALSEELRRVLADMNLGMGRRRALQGLTNRTRTPAIAALVSAILQAEQTGMGIGQVLRAQSDHLRTQRRQRAEEAAMKAPLKMLFPLVFFIFPSLFVVVLGPAMIQLLRTMSGV